MDAKYIAIIAGLVFLSVEAAIWGFILIHWPIPVTMCVGWTIIGFPVSVLLTWWIYMAND